MADRFVWRTCGNSRCVQPHHLKDGDRAAHWRFLVETKRMGAQMSEMPLNAKLTAEQVQDVRRRFDAGVKTAVLAAEYGVKPGAIRQIGLRKSWRKLPEE